MFVCSHCRIFVSSSGPQWLRRRLSLGLRSHRRTLRSRQVHCKFTHPNSDLSHVFAEMTGCFTFLERRLYRLHPCFPVRHTPHLFLLVCHTLPTFPLQQISFSDRSRRLPFFLFLFASQVLLERVPLNGTVWLSFGGANVMEMMLNWAYHVLHLGMGDRMLIGAFDETVLRELYVRYTMLSL